MNLARAGLPRMAWYAASKSATSKVMTSVRKFSREPNVTGNLIVPSGVAEVPGMTPWNGARLCFSSERGIFISSRVFGEEDVESAAAIYESPVEFDRSDDRVQHKGVAPRMWDSVRVVGPIESYWDFRPFEIFRNGRGNSVDLPSD